jgi:hypothetical protein
VSSRITTPSPLRLGDESDKSASPVGPISPEPSISPASSPACLISHEPLISPDSSPADSWVSSLSKENRADLSGFTASKNFADETANLDIINTMQKRESKDQLLDNLMLSL